MRKMIALAVASIMMAFAVCAAGLSSSSRQNAADGQTNTGGTMNITITINGNHVLKATLADNKSARAFAELLRKGEVTVSMHDYGSFEKVGSLPTALPRTDTSISTAPGDIILYQGSQITIYYDVNTWSLTRLGKVHDVTQAELKKALGAGDVTAVFALSD